MPQAAHIFRVLVASPSDCEAERCAIPQVLSSWNAAHSLRHAAILEPVLWETHATPALGEDPQGLLNRQIVDVCDILLGVFWTRLGTPTGQHESGTAEEIDRFIDAGKPVLLYFSSLPIQPERIDLEQYEALRQYREKLQEKGIVWSYSGLAEFREFVSQHIASVMDRLLPEVASMDELSEEEALAIFWAQFEILLRRMQIEWRAERSSSQPRVRAGQVILRSAMPELLDLASAIESDTEDRVLPQIESAIVQLRDLLKYDSDTLAEDGVEDFWNRGEIVVDNLWSAVRQIPRHQ